jgi:hypothetical protein
MTVFTSPHLADAIILLTLAEAAALAGFRILRPGAIARMLVPGVFVLLALRAALAGAAWPWVPVSLTAALIAHLFDLFARIRHWP